MLARTVLSLLAPPLCAACGRSAGRLEPLCAGCRRRLRWLGSEPAVAGGVAVRSAVAYEGPARALVRALKYRGALGAADAMAAQIAAALPQGWLRGAVLVPVPLARGRARRRGFNQAERLAAGVAARTGSAVLDCLERPQESGTQVGRGRAERLARLAGGVRVRPDALPPRRAVLVDDVVTTGATLAACAAALRESGCAHVQALSYARTLGR
ncbi:MAG: ComF family protein [Thermoleophilaceae bacterium]|nr:ComF family protein [Thermoleophilaceae bacterium]